MEDRGQERSGTGGQKVSDEAKQKEEKRQLGAQEGAGHPPPPGVGERAQEVPGGKRLRGRSLNLRCQRNWRAWGWLSPS